MTIAVIKGDCVLHGCQALQFNDQTFRRRGALLAGNSAGPPS
jgi:hypothetical protein